MSTHTHTHTRSIYPCNIIPFPCDFGVNKNIFGFIENISFAVDDNIIWPNADVNGNQEGLHPALKIVGLQADNHLYPQVIDVSISMKIIENHKIEKGTGGITKYKYDFDGITNSNEYNSAYPISTPFVIGETKQ